MITIRINNRNIYKQEKKHMSMFTKRYHKSLRVFHACMITTIGFVHYCYMDAYTSPIEDAILNTGIMNINTYSLFASSLYIGAGIGSLIAGPINEWLGIKTSLIIFSQLGTLGGMLLVLAYDSVSMTAARFIIGIYTSICIAGVPLYNAEVSPESTRKFYGGILGLAVRVGLLLSYFLGIWIGHRWLAVIYMMMVVFMSLNLVFLPESPKWLRNKGWNEKADKANEYFHDSPQESSPLITNESGIDTENEIPVITVTQSASLLENISSYFIWPVIRPLLVCGSIQVFKSLSGNDYLSVYSAHTLAKAVSINPRIASFFYPISLVIGSVIYLCIIHKVKWKRLLMVTTFLQLLANGMLSLAIYLSTQKYHCINNTDNIILCQILELIPILLIGMYGLSFSMGWGSLIWWLYGHILHSKYTGVSAGIVNFFLYSAAAASQLIGPIIADNLGEHILFLNFTVVLLIGFIIQLLY